MGTLPIKQVKKSLNPLWEVKLQETLNLSKSIVSGDIQLASIEMGLSITDTFSKPTIRSVFKGEYGIIGFSVVNVLITRFINSFGFSNKLDASQIEDLTVDMLENAEYESLHDIMLFLKLARSGKLGTTKRGVDSNLIFGEWFPKYLELKSELREQNYQREKNIQNNNPVTDSALKKTYKKISEAKYLKKVEEYVNRIIINMDRQMLEDTILDWQKDETRKNYVYLLKAKRKTFRK